LIIIRNCVLIKKKDSSIVGAAPRGRPWQPQSMVPTLRFFYKTDVLGCIYGERIVRIRKGKCHAGQYYSHADSS